MNVFHEKKYRMKKIAYKTPKTLGNIGLKKQMLFNIEREREGVIPHNSKKQCDLNNI